MGKKSQSVRSNSLNSLHTTVHVNVKKKKIVRNSFSHICSHKCSQIF